MRVLIYSPVRLFGECIAAFLEATDSVEAAKFECSTIDLGCKVREFRADVAVLNITTPEVIPAARVLKALCPETATVALAVAGIAEDVIACAEAGFAAHIPRNASAAQLFDILKSTLLGGTVCDPRMARSLFDELARRQARTAPFGGDHYLTPREIEIAVLLGRGSANREIAEELHVSVATIKNHVHSVLRKLNVDRRTQVAQLITENPQTIRRPQ